MLAFFTQKEKRKKESTKTKHLNCKWDTKINLNSHLNLQGLKVWNFRILTHLFHLKSLSGNRITGNCPYLNWYKISLNYISTAKPKKAQTNRVIYTRSVWGFQGTNGSKTQRVRHSQSQELLNIKRCSQVWSELNWRSEFG